MTGKANTSTVFRELFHHIATDLPESQLDAFKSHFNYDPRDPVKFQEDMAEAFEEFMRRGMADQEHQPRFVPRRPHPRALVLWWHSLADSPPARAAVVE